LSPGAQHADIPHARTSVPGGAGQSAEAVGNW